jgi:hypothetical protein
MCAQDIYKAYEDIHGVKPGPCTRKYIVANMYARDIINRKAPSTTEYDDVVFDYIIERMCTGESIAHICQDPHMPAISRLFYWVTADPKLENRYTLARKICAEVVAARAVEEACRFRPEVRQLLKADGTTEIQIVDNVMRSRIAADTLKWQASKLDHANYGNTGKGADTGGGSDTGGSAGSPGAAPGVVTYRVINSPDLDVSVENNVEELIARNVRPDEHYGEDRVREGQEDADDDAPPTGAALGGK